MVIDIERIKEDLDEARLMDVDAEVQTRLQELTADLRDEVEKERDDKIASLENLLALVEDYEVIVDEDEECEDEDEAEDEEDAEDEEVALEDVIPTAEA